MYVGDVNLDNRKGERSNAVAQGDGCMRIGTCIEHYALDSFVGSLLKTVDENSFNVALEVVEVYVGVGGCELLHAVCHGVCSVNGGFASAEAIEIGTVKDKDFHRNIELLQQTTCKVAYGPPDADTADYENGE